MFAALLLAALAFQPQIPSGSKPTSAETATTRSVAARARQTLDAAASLERDAARSAVSKLVDELVAADPEGRSGLVNAALMEAGDRADFLGAVNPSAKAWTAAVKHGELVLGDEHKDLLRSRHALARVLLLQGDLPHTRALQEKVVDVRARISPADSTELAMARVYLAETMGVQGELAEARALCEPALDVLTRALPEDHLDLQRARLKFAAIIRALGDIAGAKPLNEKVLEVLTRTVPGDQLDLQDARAEFGVTLLYTGDLAGAAKLFEQVLEVFSRTLPDDHPYVAVARNALAIARFRLGDLAGARVVQAQLLDTASRTLPDDHPDLQSLRTNLATTLVTLGDVAGARVLYEKVFEVRSRTLPDDHPTLARARSNLARALMEEGDLSAARVLQEKSLEVSSRTLPDDHPELQAWRGNLAATLMSLGDFARARELFEKVLEIDSRTLPPDHTDLQSARNNVALTLAQQGDLTGARALQEKVLEVRSRTLPADHPELQVARSNLAGTLTILGDLAGARRLLEQALEVEVRTLPADHPSLQNARMVLGDVLRRQGDAAGARPLHEQAFEVNHRTLPDAHWNLQKSRSYLAWTLAALGEHERAVDLASELARARRDAIASARGAMAPRELEEQIANASLEISTVVSLAIGTGTFDADAKLQREAFSLVECARSVGLFSASLPASVRSDPKLVALYATEKKQSAELVQLAQNGATREAVQAARRALDVTRRDRQALLAADARARATTVEPTLERLSAVLTPDQALLGYWRAKRQEFDRADASKWTASERMFAFVARPGARLSLVDLGPIDAIAIAVERWRESISAHEERGVSTAAGDPDAALTAAGNALRKLVFDPLRSKLEGANRVIVALDDALHAIPLDALPDGDGLLGAHVALEQHLSLRELLWPRETRAGSGLLVALGGASFNADPERFDDSSALAAADNAVSRTKDGVPDTLRAGPWERGFEPLTQTLGEARGIGALYEESFGDSKRVVVLEKRKASRESLTELAPRARYLHLATHGWFASESIPSTNDPAPIDEKLGFGSSMSLEQQVRGSSPMVLCGLALAGANLPKDQLGRVRGLITAEEIASLDLSSCDLAVLSACDTNVGVRRAGQGVASLQKALHMAGARSVITSLWKVPDEATKDLMLDFYRRLWVEKKPKSTALWEAKMKLRNAKDEQGRALYATRDWAAWVLTGNPD